ncbi:MULTISPECIES: EAL domain-containing protein [Pseudovibrio]|uniref:GGDEF/EAL domain-containing response regulator n=1 Tax=Stappiaceae TaxID=2821832 RepID=UPI0023659732|nr:MULTISPECIES: EAL domain-containing protein [Pseudovibrio]MDD7912090.1 EAL domain-containing protein [Pseudovibrio exalbescens]MDX5592440.1 EAL domain-containing protein [Pseudovibrio sp. SPO723]
MSIIVIIDDRAINRNILNRLALAVAGDVKTHCFASPSEALGFMEQQVPDLVVTDYSMPEMDGADLTTHIRAIEDCQDVPIMVITAFSDRTFRIKALEAGATDFLQSPVDHNEFLSRARNLLALRKEQIAAKSRASTLERELINVERQHEEELRSSIERLGQVIDSLPSMVTAVDTSGRCAFANAAWGAFMNKPSHEWVGLDFYNELQETAHERNKRLDAKIFSTGRALPPYEVEITDPQGHIRYFLVTKSPLLDPYGNTTHVVTTSTEITDRKRAEAHLLHIAHHDSLTDLPNRTLLTLRIEEQINACRKNGKTFALHFLDLDRFKPINDALGHRSGDRLLEMVGERLQSCVKQTDLVARLGGDEFAILQTDIRGSDDTLALARRIVETLEEPFYIDGQELRTGASIGITRYPEDGVGSEELLRHADMAMYQAKAEGGNVYRLFSTTMDHDARESMALEGELRQAILGNQFELYYQPQVRLNDNSIVGAEALLRWNRPGHGVVSPLVFLPLAEETGLIIPISEWVITAACQEAQRWHEMGYDDLRVAVNLSPTQFRKGDVPQLVTDALNDTGLKADGLEIEITEHIVMHGSEAVAKDLKQIQDLGTRVFIDDFGTGYSSLSYLSRFSINGLKIDRCFIQNLETDPNDAAIANAIIGLGKSLELDVVAEGIETPEQAAYLREAGCRYGQGYYYGRPMPADEFRDLVQTKHRWLVAST